MLRIKSSESEVEIQFADVEGDHFSISNRRQFVMSTVSVLACSPERLGPPTVPPVRGLRSLVEIEESPERLICSTYEIRHARQDW